jgi:hypothetical protein
MNSLLKKFVCLTFLLFAVKGNHWTFGGSNRYQNRDWINRLNVPQGTLNTIQVLANGSVLNTVTNTIIPNAFGNSSGVFLFANFG